METRYMTLSGSGIRASLKIVLSDTGTKFLISPNPVAKDISEIFIYSASGLSRATVIGGISETPPLIGIYGIALAYHVGDSLRLVIGRTRSCRLTLERMQRDVLALISQDKPKDSNVSQAPLQKSCNTSGGSAVLSDILDRANVLFRPGELQNVKAASDIAPASSPAQTIEAPTDSTNQLGATKKNAAVTKPAGEDIVAETRTYNPFPKQFPKSTWRRISKVGDSTYYLEGMIHRTGGTIVVRATPVTSPIKRYGQNIRGVDGIIYHIWRE